MNIEALLQRNDLWRGRENLAVGTHRHVPTGYQELDEALPGGGWPLGALSEVVFSREGVGELRLVMPALASLRDRWQIWIGPPHIPYAPALAAAGLDLSRLVFITAGHRDRLWAMEQALRSGACSAVLGWPDGLMNDRELRRLQLAAEEGGNLAFLFQPGPALRASPAALRLQLEGTPSGPEVHILKCRGGWARRPIRLQSHALA